jgi:hypothetical protein
MFVEDAPALDLDALMRRLRRAPSTHGTITLAPGSIQVRFEASQNLADIGAGWVRLYPPRGAPQLLRVASLPIPCGGRHAYIDLGGRRATRLRLAPDGSHFASRRALGLSYRVHHLSNRRRRLLRVERTRERLGFYGMNGIRPGEMAPRRYELLVRRAEALGVRVPVIEEVRATKKAPRGRWCMPRDSEGRWLSESQAVERIASRVEGLRRELGRVRS